MDNLAIFSNRLKEARKARGITQAELGSKIGMSYQTISSYERVDKTGKVVKGPTIENAIAIARELEVSLDWLCGVEQNDNDFRNLSCGHIARSLIAILNYDFASFGKAVSQLSVSHESLNKFVKHWEQMRNLCDQGAISEEIFNQWEKSQFDMLDKQKLF